MVLNNNKNKRGEWGMGSFRRLLKFGKMMMKQLSRSIKYTVLQIKGYVRKQNTSSSHVFQG